MPRGRGWLARRVRHARARRAALDILPAILDGVADSRRGSTRDQRVNGVGVTRSGLVVVDLTGATGEPALLKLAHDAHLCRNLRRHWRLLRMLRRHAGLDQLKPLLPVPLLTGRHAGWTFVLESRLPGSRPAPTKASRGGGAFGEPLLQLGVGVIGTLHHATLRETRVAERDIERWVSRRTRTAAGLAAERYGAGSEEPLFALAEELRRALLGRSAATSWIHGDYWPGNLLLRADGTISGVVDWDSLRGHELPLHDLLHFAITLRRLTDRRPWGWMVHDLMSLPQASAEEYAALASTYDAAWRPTTRQALGLYWLWGVESNLARHPETTRTAAWIDDNVGSVLRALK